MKLALWERARLRLVSTLIPVSRPTILPLGRSVLSPSLPQISLLDKVEVELEGARLTNVAIPPLLSSALSPNLCLADSGSLDVELAPPGDRAILSFETALLEPENRDVTKWLCSQLLPPPIEQIEVRLDSPRREGKAYTKIEEEVTQRPLFPEGERCIHGMEKNWCAICVRKERDENAPRTSASVFDIIFPILQPPLDKDFSDPITVASRLYDFQVTGIKFLVEHGHALLGDEMGLGKSIQAIVAIRVLLRSARISSGLILCPKSVLTDWEKKLWDWAPEIQAVGVRGTKDQRYFRWNTPAHIYITTYESLRQDLSGSLGEGDGADDLPKRDFDLVIFDEIQKVKNPDSGVSKAAKLIRAPMRWGLSGTPLENRLEDLVCVFDHIRPGILHRGHAGQPWMVREAIRPHFLRRRKKEALPDLPEKVSGEAWLELSDLQRQTYDKAERQGIIELNEQGEQITVQHVLALITKLKQICNVDPVSKESSKLEFVKEKLEELVEQDDKALVFSQYPQKTLPHLKSQLQEFCPLEYSGVLSETERDLVVKRFSNDDRARLLLMSVKAGGLGLTLTRANYVFHFDLWWNPAVASQAEDRTHRIGQHKTVFVTYLYTVNTIEEKIESLLSRKRELFKEMVDDLSDTNLGRVLSKEDLLSLFNIKLEVRRPSGHVGAPGAGARSLTDISADEFERLVSRLYELMGYHVRKTAATHDRGVDVYAKRQTESGLEHLAIQCKHYPNSVVGVEHARALYGVIQADPSVTKGILLTSGSFSRDCKEFASGKRLELVDGSYLRGLLEKYNVPSTSSL